MFLKRRIVQEFQTQRMITRIIVVPRQKILLHGTCSFFHEFSQLDIFDWQSSTVMGCQSDLDFAVNIKPFRVMIHFLWQESNTSHKTKCLVKILKFELLINGITTLNFTPPWWLQGLKVCFPFLCSKFEGLWWRLTTTRTKSLWVYSFVLFQLGGYFPRYLTVILRGRAGYELIYITIYPEWFCSCCC